MAKRYEYKRAVDAPLMPWVLYIVSSYLISWEK